MAAETEAAVIVPLHIEETTRMGRPEDREAIMALLVRMHAETATASFDEDKVYASIDAVLDKGIVIMAEHGGIAVGTVGLVFAEPWYSKDHELHDRWFFVHPDFRAGKNHAKNLIMAVKRLAAKLAIDCYIGVWFTPETEGKVKFFARHGKPVAAMFKLRDD